jgi:hypothetical protein
MNYKVVASPVAKSKDQSRFYQSVLTSQIAEFDLFDLPRFHDKGGKSKRITLSRGFANDFRTFALLNPGDLILGTAQSIVKNPR